MIDQILANKIVKRFLIILAVFLVLISGALFTVEQRQQALVLQFGEPVRLIQEPGLKFKIPFVQNVQFFDKRILDLGVRDQEVIASDQKRLIINAFAKFKIVDPLKFYTTVRNIYGINSRLGAILDSSLRQIIGEVPLKDILTESRGKIMKNIRNVVSKESEIFGVEIIDVRIVRGDLPKENSEAIFARMQTEREKEAREIRANGAEKAQKIKAEANKDRTIILAEARKNSSIVKGQGDALATRIYAKSFGLDPEFSYFYLSMKAYRDVLKNDNTKLVIAPEGEFFDYFNDDGKVAQNNKVRRKKYSKKKRYNKRGKRSHKKYSSNSR